MKCGFSIGYSIGRKYQPILVSVSVSDINQNSGFGRQRQKNIELYEAGCNSTQAKNGHRDIAVPKFLICTQNKCQVFHRAN